MQETKVTFPAPQKNKTDIYKDPLWEVVCAEVMALMGSAGFPLKQCVPGNISYKDETAELDCQSEEAISFVGQFDFLILGALKQYFPSLKKVRIKGKIPQHTH